MMTGLRVWLFLLLAATLALPAGQPLRFTNTYASAPNGTYRWTVYLDERSATLQKISCVEYRLHPTFPNPVQKICSPQKKFALTASGWGEFTIFITVHWQDGHLTNQSYPLNLHSHFAKGKK
jgi:transcription initiation factor IIF auxiliary subunit